MAVNIGAIGANITANPEPLRKGLQQAAGHVSRFAEQAESATDRIGSIGTRMAVAITTPILAAGAFSVRAAADMERLRMGLEAITGSSDVAAAQMARMEEVAKLPGLGFAEAIQGSIRLQAVRIEAGLAERILKSFGNAVALVGGGKAELDGVTLALSQIAGKGKVAAEEINQLAERAPQVRAALIDAFGTADTEKIQKLGLSTTVFMTRLVAEMEKLPSAGSGVANSFENLGDSLFRARAAIGEVLLPVVIPLIDKLSAFLVGVREADSGTLRWAVGIAAAAAAIGPLLVGAAVLVSSYRTLRGALNIAPLTAWVREAATAGGAKRRLAAAASFAAKVEAAAAAESTAARQRETASIVANMQATQAAIRVSRAEAIAKLQAAQVIQAQAARVPIASLAPLGGLAVEREMARRAAATRAASEATRQLAVLGQQEARVKQISTAANRAHAAATVASAAAARSLTVATTAHTAALARHTIAARLASVASRGFAAVMAFLGGPIGLAITAVGLLALAFWRMGDRAREAAAKARQAAADFRVALSGMDDAALESARVAANQVFAGSIRQIERFEAAIADQQAAIGRLTRAGVRLPSTADASSRDPSKRRITEEQRELQGYTAALNANRAALVRAQAARDRALQSAVSADREAGRRLTATTPPPDVPDTGSAFKTFMERASTLRSLYSDISEAAATTADGIQRRAQQLAPVGEALSGVFEAAQRRLAALGDALSGEALEQRSALLSLVNAIQSLPNFGFRPIEAPDLLPMVREVDGRLRAAGGGFVGRMGDAMERAIGLVPRLAADLSKAGGAAVNPIVQGIREARIEAKRLDLPNKIAQMRSALREAGNATQGRMSESFEYIIGRLEGILSSIPQLKDFGAGYRAARDDGGQGVFMSVLAGSGLMIGLELLSSAFNAMRPAFEALMVPITIVGELLGSLLTPVLKLIFPVFKGVGIAATYVVEAFARVAQGLTAGLGFVLRGLGRFINAITPFANPGNPLIRAGEAMQRASEGFGDTAREAARTRDELRNLSFEEALNSVTDAANRAARAMVNMVEGFKVERYGFSATTPGPTPAVASYASAPSAGVSNTVQGGSFNFVFNSDPKESPEQTYARWYRGAETAAQRDPGARAFLANMPRPGFV